MACGEWEQGDIASLLDGAGQTALVRGADSSKPPGNDLAALGNEALQKTDVPIWDGVDFFRAELADLFAAEELASAAGAGRARSTGRARSARST